MLRRYEGGGAQAKIPFVVFNAGTSSVVQKSPFFVRTGFTQWAVSTPVTRWAAQQGFRSCAIDAADYAPGHDAIEAYTKGFAEAGGRIAAEIRVPMGTTDFSSYLQRVRDATPQCTFMFMPVGPMSDGFIKAYGERGLAKAGIQLVTGAETQEFDLPAIGDSTIGVVTALHYGPHLDNPANKAFVQAYKAKYGKDALPSLISVAAYDGIKVVFDMIRATDGKRDGVKAIEAVRGMKRESPRGPSTSIRRPATSSTTSTCAASRRSTASSSTRPSTPTPPSRTPGSKPIPEGRDAA